MLPRLPVLLLLFAGAAVPGVAAPWDRVNVPPAKTSIYFGSVTLTLSPLARTGGELKANYEARVFPWFFWSEHGALRLQVSDADWLRLEKGERVEFSGEARNGRHKLRTITGYAQPAGATGGKIKVRIAVDGIELIFNGTYRLEAAAG